MSSVSLPTFQPFSRLIRLDPVTAPQCCLLKPCFQGFLGFPAYLDLFPARQHPFFFIYIVSSILCFYLITQFICNLEFWARRFLLSLGPESQINREWSLSLPSFSFWPLTQASNSSPAALTAEEEAALIKAAVSEGRGC